METTKVWTAAAVGLLLVFSGLYGGAQTVGMPDGWVESRLPFGSSGSSEVLQCANYSQDEWRVKIESGEVRIVDSGKQKHPSVTLPPHFERTKEMPGRMIAVKVGDGWLLGFDAGEFGGGLWWSSADGSLKKHLSEENVQVILSRGEEALVLTGLDHMGSNKGTAYSYRPANGAAGDLVRIADLGSAPDAAIFRSDGTLLIAAQTRVLELTSGNRLRVVFQNDDMGMLYPNSIVEVKNGPVLIGMRFYVLQLKRGTDNSYVPSWFIRSQCTTTRVTRFRCVCTGNGSNK